MLGPAHHLVGIIRGLLGPVLEQRPLGARSNWQYTSAHPHHEKRAGKRHILIARIRRPCAIIHVGWSYEKDRGALWTRPGLIGSTNR